MIVKRPHFGYNTIEGTEWIISPHRKFERYFRFALYVYTTNKRRWK